MQRFNALFSIVISIIASFAIASCSGVKQLQSEASSNAQHSTKNEKGKPLSDFIPFLNDIVEDDIIYVSYQVRKNEFGVYKSFCDPVANYEDTGQEDIHRVYEFLKNCRVYEYTGSSKGYSSKTVEVTYTIHFEKDKLECVARGRCVDYFYGSSEIGMYYLKREPKNISSYTELSLPFPEFENFIGYSYDNYVLEHLDIFNRSEQLYAGGNREILTKMLFVDDDFFPINEYNKYNKYVFSNNSYGYIVFENSKQFTIEHGNSLLGDYGHYRIVNNFSFEDFRLQDIPLS